MTRVRYNKATMDRSLNPFSGELDLVFKKGVLPIFDGVTQPLTQSNITTVIGLTPAQAGAGYTALIMWHQPAANWLDLVASDGVRWFILADVVAGQP